MGQKETEIYSYISLVISAFSNTQSKPNKTNNHHLWEGEYCLVMYVRAHVIVKIAGLQSISLAITVQIQGGGTGGPDAP